MFLHNSVSISDTLLTVKRVLIIAKVIKKAPGPGRAMASTTRTLCISIASFSPETEPELHET